VKKFKTWFKDHKSVITRIVIFLFLLIALPLTLYLNSRSQDTRQRAAENTSSGVLACTFDLWQPVPDWAKGNDGVGNNYYCGPENPENHAICAAYLPGLYDEGGNGSGRQVPGPAMPAGTVMGAGGHAPSFSISFGGKLPVNYNGTNDIIRFEFTGKLQESAWSRVVRRMDDDNFITYASEMPNHTIATGVLLKYEIMRVAREAFFAVVYNNPQNNEGPSAADIQKQLVAFMKQETGQPGGQTFTAQAHYRLIGPPTAGGARVVGEDTYGKPVTRALLSQLMGFDITNLDIASWGSLNASGQWDSTNETVRHQQMVDETKACGTAIPTPVPTSTTPVSCNTHLSVPPADFAVNIPAFTPNICSEATVYDGNIGHAYAKELIDCGDYWVTNWCNASTADEKSNVTYACRGWSQNDKYTPNLVYFPKRIFAVTNTQGSNGDSSLYPGGALLSNINKYGDVEGRRVTWNNLMAEVKSGGIAFPYGYKDVAGALQAAAAAIFDKPWGAVVEQERLNNCSTTWDGIPNEPTITVTTEPSISPIDETRVNVTLKLDGIGSAGDFTNPTANDKSNKTPHTAERSFALLFLDSSNAVKYTKIGKVNYDSATGTFKGVMGLSDVEAGTYSINVKMDQYLIKNIPSVTINKNDVKDLPTVTLTTGDINGDNKLTILDYNTLADCYSDISKPVSCTDANKLLTDLNDDGKVNQFDYNLFVRELPKSQGD
jgi:hypothetical protein